MIYFMYGVRRTGIVRCKYIQNTGETCFALQGASVSCRRLWLLGGAGVGVSGTAATVTRAGAALRAP